MELKNKKPRVFSAKYPQAVSEKVRPLSGLPTHQHKRQEAI